MAQKPISASWVKKRWEDADNRRSSIDQEGWQNLAFIYGEHYSIFDNTSKVFVKPDLSDGRTRLKINHVKSMWRGELARLMKARPIPEVIAPSDQDIDARAAKAANRLLNAELERLEFEVFRSDLLMWVTSAGYAYAHVYWDPESEQGQGNVGLDIVLGQELAYDPSVRRHLKEGRYVIHGRVLPKEVVEERYGRTFPTDKGLNSLNMQQMVSGWQGSTATEDEDGILVLRLWHLPCPQYPKGLLLTVIGDEEVERKDFPYNHKRLPFIAFHHIRLPGRFEGQSVVTDLISPQKDYNQARSRLAEMRAFMTSPQMLAPEGSLDIERLSTTPGAVVNFRQVGMFKPEPLNLGTPPGFLFQEAQTAYSEMQDIARQHEVSQGQIPSAGMPASAVAMLQETDDVALGPTTIGIERGIAEIGRQVLSLVQQYWDTQRAVRTWSEETNSITVERFMGSDINEAMDVQVTPGSAQPRNKAQQRQDLLALFDRGIVRDPRLLVRHMEMPNSEGIMRTLDRDTRHAQREHDLIFKMFESAERDPESLAQARPVLPEPFHNHDVHIAEHNDFRKTEEFESWGDDARAYMAQHVELHETQRLEQMQKMATEQFMMMPPGEAPGGGGTPPAPPGPPGSPPGPPNPAENPGVNAPDEEPPVVQ